MGIGGNMKNAFTTFRVKSGRIGLVGSEKGIQRIYLPGLKEEELQKRILSDFPECRRGADFLSQAQRELTEYFSGGRVNFTFPLDLSKATPFQKRAYTIMGSIPFGEVRTYRWLAGRLGNPKALRAVGGANAKNRWPIVIPCHRVIGSNGFLTGFSAPGGLALKTALLELEGIPVEKNRVMLQPANS
jgi:methylated-DNA-[protein]-cysteine S-methyltransferase